jgi:hypothetical protein
MGRSAARFDAKNCSNFAHNGFGEMGVCCQDPIRIAHLKDLPPVTNYAGFSRFAAVSESRSTTRPIRD